MNKVCTKCGIEKDISEFGVDKRTREGILHRCRTCVYGKERKKRVLEDTSDGYKTCTACKLRHPLSQYFINTSQRSGLFSRCKTCIALKSARFYRLNKPRLLARSSEYNAKHSQRTLARINSDVQLLLKRRLRTRLWMAMKADYKAGSAVSDLGCSIEQLKSYLESLFTSGMTWDNWGKGPGNWNIDHIKPLSIVDLTNRQHVLEVCHYSNLQPLWFEDNRKKSNHYEPDVQRLGGEIPIAA